MVNVLGETCGPDGVTEPDVLSGPRSGKRSRVGSSGPESVLLVGPASPRDVAELLSGGDRDRAETIVGYRGLPVSELAKALVAAGLRVEVATTAREVDEPTTFEGENFRIHLVPMRLQARDRALTFFQREREGLARVIRTSEARLVHAHWTYEFAWAALGSGRPVVVTAHDAPLTVLRHYRDPYRAIRTAMAYAVRLRTHTLTAVSPYLAGRWRCEMGFRHPIAVVPNIAPELWSALPAAAGTGRVRIVDVASSQRLKNVASLVHAFRLLHECTPGVELDLVGAGLAPGDEFAQELRRRGSCEGIQFLGELGRDALAEVLAAARVFVHPSREECCSMAVLEAMWAGIPVVGGRKAGGTPWMLDHGGAGVLVDVENPAAIARGVAGLLDDDLGARELAKRARHRVEAVFSARAVVSGYLDVYECALRKAA